MVDFSGRLQQYPNMIDLSTWNITVPEQVPARTVETRLLKAGFSNKYFYRNGPVIIFWSPVTGTTKGSSSFPRSELRETFKDGKLRNWYYSEGTHTMRASLAVNKVPSEGRIVIGQVQSKDNPTPFVKLVYTQLRGVGYIQVMVRHRPYDVKSPVVMTYKSMPLDYPFTYTLQVTKSGQLKVDVAGQQYEEKIHAAWAKKRFYFKAGVYTLDNRGPSTEGGKATFSALSVTHKP